MAVSGSSQLSPLLGLCRNREHGRQQHFKCLSGWMHRDVPGTSLSSCASRQDSWSHHLSVTTNRPICVLPHRCNSLRCHSFLFFGRNATIHSAKTATVALERSCSNLQSNLLVNKIVPAVGIIIFALCGLGPLVRRIRKTFLSKTDSGWKKSTANYVLTSYLRPILLWTGATLICRALGPITMPTDASQLVKKRLLNFVQSLSTVLAFAYCLSCVVQQTHKYFMESNDPDDTRNMGFQFAGKAVYTAVWVAAVSLFMELLGFSARRWLTAGGLGTLLLTLAGREIFTNFLSSAMIHATRPFVLNEWIQAKIEGYEVSGTVEHVGWWSPTIIRGDDREAVHIPNHKFTVNVVRNLSQKTHWRINTHLAISHLDVSKINNIVADMRKVLAKNPQVEQQKLHRRVFLENINPEDQALMILVSCFVKTSHVEEYLCVKEAILLDLLRVISHHRARLATPIRTIQKFYSDAELDSVSFPDSMFGRSGPASKRPMLLIEPSYKISGENKLRSQQTRSTHSSGDQNSRDPKPDNKATVKAVSKTSSESDDSGSAVDGKSLKSSENSQSKGKAETKSGDEKSSGFVKGSGSEPSKLGHGSLEENLVLGVALEGSKRTLPIEEGLDSPSEARELSARSNGNGNSLDKDEKDR